MRIPGLRRGDKNLKSKLFAGLGLALFLVVGFSMAGIAQATPPGSVYTETNAASNSVLQFQTGAGGALTLVGTFSAEGSGTGAALASQGAVVLTQEGHWLLAVDAASNQVTVFQVNGGGSLAVTDVVSSQGTTPISLTVSNNDQFVYVLNSGTPDIAGFSLTNGGQLNFIAGSIQPLSGIPSSSPEQIGFAGSGPGPASPGGSSIGVLVVTEKAAGVIDTYTVGANGIESPPTVTQSNGAGPYGFAFTNSGFLVLSEAGSASVSSYAVSSAGTLRTISGALPDFGSITSTGAAPCWLEISHNGQFAYADNAHVGTISVYSISGQGTLSLVSAIAAHTQVPSLDLAVSGNGQYLYALNGGQITSFQTYPDGGLSQVSTISTGFAASATGLAAT